MRSIALIVCLCLSACGGEARPPLVATDVVIVRPMPGKHMSAGYLTLTNNTDAAIVITRVASDDFEGVEMHESLLEDGVAKMRRIEQLKVPAGASVSFQRGGKHLMLMGASGTSDVVSLRFYSGEILALTVRATFAPGTN